MCMFHVAKGGNIQTIYNGSKSGLNDLIWALQITLPTADTMTHWVTAGSWLADNGYGEQFLNFSLHPDLQKFCGVDLIQFFPQLDDDKLCKIVGVWLRSAMGLKSSPYNLVQGALQGIEWLWKIQ